MTNVFALGLSSSFFDLKLLLSHLTGSANSRQAAMAFHEVNELAECHHTLAWITPPLSGGFWPPGLVSQFQRRCFPDLPREKLKTHPWPEIIRLASRVSRFPILTNWLRRRYDIQTVNRHFDEAVARRLSRVLYLTAVYGYFDTSLHTFRTAKKLGLRTIYELPTPYWRTTQRILKNEAQRSPAWAGDFPSLRDDDPVMKRRDAELQLADVVIVPSTFVRDSLNLAPAFKAKVFVIPYGCPTHPSPKFPNSPNSPNSPPSPISHHPFSAAKLPLRLLFVGTLSQTKGLADLLEAVAPLGNQIELTLAGSAPSDHALSILKSRLSDFDPPIRLLGQLPHEKLLAELPGHDLMVLPTLYEGLSLALLEALAAGVPVLTTNHSGLDGLMGNGSQGFIVPICQPDMLRARIQSFISDRPLLLSMSRQALEWAGKHSWSLYRQNLREAVEL